MKNEQKMVENFSDGKIVRRQKSKNDTHEDKNPKTEQENKRMHTETKR